MRLAITGGKGGTGKSTIATALSFELAKKYKVALIDVDVECPDDHIILSIERNKVKEVETLLPFFDLRSCKKCGKCSQTCRENAIFFVKGKYPILISQQCNGCGACINVCPENSIKKDRQIIGSIYHGKLGTDFINSLNSSFFKTSSAEILKNESNENVKENIQKNFLLISGEVEVGCEATSLMVNSTRKYAEQLEQDFDFLIIDTPAGTHCNVISALTDIDLAIAVTEPTPFGAHDLELILKLLEKIAEQGFEPSKQASIEVVGEFKKYNSQTKIIINRSDIGDKNLIYHTVDPYGIEVLEEITYDKSFLENYSKGIPITNQKIEKIANYVRFLNE
jgi:MinD superfamily P-loop ATPase